MPLDHYRATRISGGTVLLPPLRRFPGGVYLHGSCRPAGVLAHNAIGRLIGIHPRLAAARDRQWAPPLGHAFQTWLARLRDTCRINPVVWVVLLPRDPRRSRFGLLLLNSRGQRLAFAKFTRNPANPLELRALAGLSRVPVHGLWTPTLLDHGMIEGWSYLVTDVMPNGPHRPASAKAALEDILPLLQTRLLGEGIGDGKDSWPVHGDFGPWNVRRIGRTLALVDWEEMTIGPKAADQLWFVLSLELLDGAGPEAAVTAVRSALAQYSDDDVRAAATFWLDRHRRPEAPEIDASVPMPPRLSGLPERVVEALQSLTS